MTQIIVAGFAGAAVAVGIATYGWIVVPIVLGAALIVPAAVLIALLVLPSARDSQESE